MVHFFNRSIEVGEWSILDTHVRQSRIPHCGVAFCADLHLVPDLLNIRLGYWRFFSATNKTCDLVGVLPKCQVYRPLPSQPIHSRGKTDALSSSSVHF
jgi:hypothetical protein